MPQFAPSMLFYVWFQAPKVAKPVGAPAAFRACQGLSLTRTTASPRRAAPAAPGLPGSHPPPAAAEDGAVPEPRRPGQTRPALGNRSSRRSGDRGSATAQNPGVLAHGDVQIPQVPGAVLERQEPSREIDPTRPLRTGGGDQALPDEAGQQGEPLASQLGLTCRKPRAQD